MKQNFDYFLSIHVTNDSIKYMNLNQQTYLALTSLFDFLFCIFQLTLY